jgi:hypothetical protein
MIGKKLIKTQQVYVYVLFLLVFASLGIPASGFGDSSEQENVSAEITQKMQRILVLDESPEIEVTETRALQSIVASGAIYNIIKETAVYIGDKEQITMDNLPVPCKATITYQPLRNNARNAIRIDILKIYPGASIHWTPPAPE